ncbi:MAG: sigma-70 family RNA polymerase sigma factor [Candidatus Euphemobacter frigidus]|nr:sigma-70 family RNA polymerase sigma factor [Candidatus Euphemobacter frigidus]MDP8276328.1 sigma-70 family RNA polymerase sigma factor [Candidatus Euphemobacter frigidus]
MADKKDDFELVRATRKGDREAFGELVRKYQGKIYSLAYGMVGNPAAADDLAQEIFLKTYRNIKKFRFKSSFYTWLYRIALNTVITRRKKLREDKHLELKPQILDIQGSPYLPARLQGEKGDRAMTRKELRRDIRQALETLSDKHKAVVVMHDIEGIPHNDIAGIISCSEGTVRSRLHYARRRLREQLANWLE